MPATTSTTMNPSEQPERDRAASRGRRRPRARGDARGGRVDGRGISDPARACIPLPLYVDAFDRPAPGYLLTDLSSSLQRVRGVVVRLLFYPRGGSASTSFLALFLFRPFALCSHVRRRRPPRRLMAPVFPLGAQPRARRCRAPAGTSTIVSGSLTLPGRPGDARAFYRGLDVRPVDMTRALDAPDPLLADPPLHPSYEDRAGRARPRLRLARRRRRRAPGRRLGARAAVRRRGATPTSCTCTT